VASSPSSSLSSRHGVPATIKLDYGLIESLGEQPQESQSILRLYLELSQKDLAFSSLLGDYMGTRDGLHPDPLPIMKSVDPDIERIARPEATWPPSLERWILGVKLRLYSFALSYSCHTDKFNAGTRFPLSADPSLDVANFVSKLYTVSMRIIHISTVGTGESINAADNHKYWMSFDFQSFALAVAALLHITILRQNSFDNTESASAIRRAWNLLKSCSLIEGDHYSRFCEVIDFISKSQWPVVDASTSKLPIPQVAVRARMGANLLNDVLRTARRRFAPGSKRMSQKLAGEISEEKKEPDQDQRSKNGDDSGNMSMEDQISTLDIMNASMMDNSFPDIAFSTALTGVTPSFDNYFWTDWERNLYSNPYL
jgi:hypothetical protein